MDVLQTYQGVVDGERNEDDAYGGSADFVVNADFGKLGLWPGGFLKLFGEVQFGNSINADTGAVLAASTDALFPPSRLRQPNALPQLASRGCYRGNLG